MTPPFLLTPLQNICLLLQSKIPEQNTILSPACHCLIASLSASFAISIRSDHISVARKNGVNEKFSTAALTRTWATCLMTALSRQGCATA